MKKIYPITLVASAIVLLLFFLYNLFVGFDPHHKLAENPESIEEIIDADLPQYVILSSSDNLSRSTSRFDCYTHTYRFDVPLSQKQIETLDRLCEKQPDLWTKIGNGHSYSYQSGNWDMYYVECSIGENSASLEYYIDESEGVLNFALWLCIVAAWYVFMLLWGFVLLVIYLIKRSISRKSPV